MPLEPLSLFLACVAAMLVGFSKCGLPGMGILVVPLMAMAFPAKQSVGVLLPMLIAGDLFAVGFYRRHAQWGKLWGLFPSVAAGMVIATWTLSQVDSTQMKPILGWLVLGLIVLDYARRRAGWHAVPHHPVFVVTMGFLGGFGTTMGNVAGPIMTIYFLSRGLEKNEFLGTFSWFFLIVNLTKVPLFAGLGMITWGSLALNGYLVPLIALGALVGRWLLPRIPERMFGLLVMLLAAVAALKLVW